MAIIKTVFQIYGFYTVNENIWSNIFRHQILNIWIFINNTKHVFLYILEIIHWTVR
jgi:hypothetical protein